MRINIGNFSLCGEIDQSGNINVTSIEVRGPLETAIARLLGISTIAVDDKQAEPPKVQVSDMSVLRGAPAGPPNLGVSPHVPPTPPTGLPRSSEEQLDLPFDSPEVQPPLASAAGVFVPPALTGVPPTPPTITPTMVSQAIQPVETALSQQPSQMPPVASTPPVASAVQVSPTMLAAFGAPQAAPPAAPPANSLTSLSPQQQQIASTFSVTTPQSAMRLPIVNLSAENQQFVISTFSRVQASGDNVLREALVSQLKVQPEIAAGLDRASMENMIWNSLVQSKA